MPLVCVQCSLKALIEKQPLPTFLDETIIEHITRLHSDPEAVKAERLELERRFAEMLEKGEL